MIKNLAASLLLVMLFSVDAVAGNGKLYIAVSGGVAVADTATNEAWGVIKAGPSSTSITLTPDNKYLMVPDFEGRRVRMIDTAADKVVNDIMVSMRPYAMGIMADGRYAVVSGQGNAVDDTYDTNSIIDMNNLKEIAQFKADSLVNEVKISPDGYAYIIYDAGVMQILDINERKVVQDVKIPKGVYQAAFSKDGATLFLSSQEEKELAVMDLKSFKIVKRITPGGYGRGLAISPDGKEIWYGGPAGNISVYNVESGKIIVIPRETDVDFFIEFGSDTGMAYVGASGEDGKKIYVYDSLKKKKTGEIPLQEIAGKMVFVGR